LANALARSRRARAAYFEERVNRLALEDNWPAGIANWSVLMRAFADGGKRLTAVTEQGLLWLLADALADPWASAGATPAFDDRRLLRLAMVAGGAMSNPIAAEAARSPEVLLPVGRLHHDDEALAVLVRSYELYCELLPSVFPRAIEAFEGSVGISVSQWIVDACRTFLATRKWLKMREDGGATLNLSPTQENLPPDYERIHATAKRLSASRQEFRTAFAKAPQDSNRGLRFEPLRRWPLLTSELIGEHLFVVLHLDFLLGAADDGVFYRVLDALDSVERDHFLEKFGLVYESYVESVLRRAVSGLPGCGFARLDDGTERTRRRCDFAVRILDDLVLVDAKRCGVSAAMVEGRTDMRTRLDEQVAKAASQFIQTAKDVERGAVEALPTHLGVAEDWHPRRTFGLIVHHHPLFLWFESTRQVLQRQGLSTEWDRLFASAPIAWSTSELERRT
jgi:hypothetical protein